MSNRKVLIVVIILMIALSTSWFLDRPIETDRPLKQASDDPEFYMKNASIKQLDKEGNIQHIVSANEFIHFSLSQITSMSEPEIQLFSEEEIVPWNIVSENGEILPKKNNSPETLQLWGNVLASISYSDGDFINIKSEKLKVIPESEFIEAFTDVSIENSFGSTTAAGMNAFLEKKLYNFVSRNKTRVHSVFTSESSSNDGKSTGEPSD